MKGYTGTVQYSKRVTYSSKALVTACSAMWPQRVLCPNLLTYFKFMTWSFIPLNILDGSRFRQNPCRVNSVAVLAQATPAHLLTWPVSCGVTENRVVLVVPRSLLALRLSLEHRRRQIMCITSLPDTCNQFPHLVTHGSSLLVCFPSLFTLLLEGPGSRTELDAKPSHGAVTRALPSC
jgi:hypothetical protein